jgi:hypothetical protein
MAFARLAVFLLAAMTAACAATGELPPPRQYSPAELSQLRYKAVLIAGQRNSTAFDHATQVMRDRLLARQVPPADIQRLSATWDVIAQDGVRSASLDHVLAAIERIQPGPGQGCLVFATSHGGFQQGVELAASGNFLRPETLDEALVRGCGNAPTVVIISACFSGNFTRPPMARANRIVLTAARSDRTSFGCDARAEFTFYDRCLLQAMDHAVTWRAAYALIRTCVSDREKAGKFVPSEPRAWFGDAVEGMPIPRPPS